MPILTNELYLVRFPFLLEFIPSSFSHFVSFLCSPKVKLGMFFFFFLNHRGSYRSFTQTILFCSWSQLYYPTIMLLFRTYWHRVFANDAFSKKFSLSVNCHDAKVAIESPSLLISYHQNILIHFKVETISLLCPERGHKCPL